ncbi:MAG: hypothetical protein ABSG05_03405 [Candidatus Pacearchaeota archaeon]|jgi:hypothetical protein
MVNNCLWCGEPILEGINREYHPICVKRKYNFNNRKKASEYFQKNKEKIYSVKRIYNIKNKEKIDEIKRKYRIKNREILNKKALKHSKKNRDKINKYHKEWKKNNKKIVNAENQASIKIQLLDSCQICGSKENLQRHHWDYNRPLLVTTLCKDCHRIQHIKNFENSFFGRVSC